MVFILIVGMNFKMDITEMKVSLNKEFKLSLEANPTTGYTWEVEFGKDFLRLKEKIFEPYPSKALGIGGKEEFIFIPIKTGETNIIMRYKRAWEEKAIDEKNFRIIIIN